jgi:hypothetical protein
MARRASLVLLFTVSIWVLPSVAQTSLLPTLERIRPEYPRPWSNQAQIGEYLNRVAWEHRAEGWGLLRKTGGTRCPSPQGVEIACDILIHAPTQTHFDVLIDSTGVGDPTWRLVGPCDPSISGCAMDRFVAPIGRLSPPRNLRVVG